MKPSFRCLLTSAAIAVIAFPSAHAAIVLYINDQAGFNTAVTSKVLNGTENWSSAGNASLTLVNDAIMPGIANGPFAQGTNVNTGLQVQSNKNGEISATLSPRGSGGLFYAPTGTVGNSGSSQPTNQLSTGTAADSMDMIMNLPHVQAVSFSAMYYQGNGTQPTTGTITFRIYNKAGTLIQSGSIANVPDVAETSTVGLVATNGEDIGRINIWAGTANFVGADNITVYSVPEASAALLTAAGSLALLRRRRA